MPKKVCVIGASAGGVEALKDVVQALPKEFPAAICVVLHVPPYVRSCLPEILSKAGQLPALHPEDGTEMEDGVIYIAPPDYHLLIEKNCLAVKKGPKENRFRPSIDALFRSAANSFGPRAIGVVLSGALDDGTSGLWNIKRCGGIAVIQEPSDARFESMPLSALEYVEMDYRLPASEIGGLLERLAFQTEKEVAVDNELKKRLQTEVEIAAEGGAFQKGIMEMGSLTPFTCPECHGVLVKIAEGRMSRFRCHTGHAYTDNALLESVMESAGEMLWQVMRTLEEGVMLLDNMGKHLEGAGDTLRAGVFFSKARQIEQRSKMFHELVLQHESLSGDNLGQPATSGR